MCELTAAIVTEEAEEADEESYTKGFFTSFCKNCSQPIGGEFETRDPFKAGLWLRYYELTKFTLRRHLPPDMGNTDFGKDTKIPRIWPRKEKPVRFDYLPSDVNSAMNDAEETRSINAPPRVIRTTYRTVIDVATKEILLREKEKLEGATLKRNDLFNRIEFLTEHGILTPTLRDWAQGIRFITNESVHTAEDVTRVEADEIAEFTRMLLQYLYELPGRVERAKAEAEQKRTSTKVD